ncbi:cupredoxin domain-containing protein [Kitasatospora sp. LaBMicrA B282]|uniref:cupredoxin domain-containing protein n=1 Tax=Kitasatospora sp. LaBMicrA B282 TaxID=3420949 RepID=UPI003D1064B6
MDRDSRHRARRRARRAAPALLLAALALVTGCSSSSAPKAGSTPGSGASGSATAVAGGSAGTGTSITVTEKEYSVTPERTQLTPGTYTFVAANTGTVEHALAIAGPGVAAIQTDAIAPGGRAQVTVTLQAGSYELWCPIDGHKALGMDTHVQVAAGSS